MKIISLSLVENILLNVIICIIKMVFMPIKIGLDIRAMILPYFESFSVRHFSDDIV